MTATQMSAADIEKAAKAEAAAKLKAHLAKLCGEASPKAVADALAVTCLKHQTATEAAERTALEGIAEDLEAFASPEMAAHGITGEELDALMGKLLTEQFKARGLKDVKGHKSRVRTIALMLLNAPPVVVGDNGKVVPWDHAPKKREAYRAYYERVTAILPTLKTRDGRDIIPSNEDGTRAGQGAGGGRKPGEDAQGSGGNTAAGSGASANPAKAAKEARENAAATLMGDAKAAAALLAWLESAEGKAVVAKLKQA